MQMVKNIFIIFLLGWFTILVFMPKQSLYYKLEQELEKNEIKINEKRIESGLFSVTIYEADIYIKGIKLATIEKVDFFTLLFYSTVNIKNLLLDETLENMVPTQIDLVELTHHVIAPMSVKIDATGSFGGLAGIALLDESTVRLDFNESKNIEILKPQLLEDEKGWYYETSF